jgi:hypothetical protein
MSLAPPGLAAGICVGEAFFEANDDENLRNDHFGVRPDACAIIGGVDVGMLAAPPTGAPSARAAP